MSESKSDLNKTILCEEHIQLNARMIDFGGWYMPVQYAAIKAEHQCVREAVGLFDISHMGTFIVKGPESHSFMQKMFPNNLDKLYPSKGLYTQLCYDNGGIIDDLIVYQLEDEHYLLIVNGANRDKDFKWLSQHKPANVELGNVSEYSSILALQGPEATTLMAKISTLNPDELQSFHVTTCSIDGLEFQIARTGYTGEDGFELFVPTDITKKIWQILLDKGQEFGIQPIGLGARDTLRLEAALPLYGHDLSDDTNPIEAGLGWSVKTKQAEDFIGKEALKKQRKDGLSRKRIGFELIDTRRAPREGYAIMHEDKLIGKVTSGTLSPTLDKPIGMGYIDAPYFKELTQFEIDIRGKRYPAQVVKMPFYRRTSND